MLYSTVQCQGEAKLLSYLLSTDYSYRLVQLRFQCFDTVYWDSGFGLVWVEFNAPPYTKEVISEVVFTANHLTDTDKQNSTEKYKQTQYKSEKVNNLKYSKIKLPGFSCLLQHSARKRGGLILQRPRAHTGLGIQEEHPACKIVSDEVLVWSSIWSEEQIVCILSSWCHCNPENPIIPCHI